MKKNWKVQAGLLSAAAGFTISTAAFAVNTPEVEPNDAKATATLVTMAAGDSFSGNSISATTTGIDYFLVSIPADGVLTRYELNLTTTGTAGHSMTLRGLNVSGGVVGTTDTSLQTATTITATSARRAVFYGTGGSGNRDIYVRVTGTASTIGDYTVTLSSSAVTETAAGGGGTVAQGSITLGEGTGSNADHDWWVYDSALAAIPTANNDDPDSGATISLTPATYHVAWGNFNTANNLPSTNGTFLTGAVTDFPNVVLNTSTANVTNIGMGITSAAGNVQVPLARLTTTGVSGQFDINWVALTVEAATTNPAVAGNAFFGSNGDSVLVTGTVTPGTVPASTGLAVTADLSAIGGSATQTLFDDGTNGDVTGGDNIFSFSATITGASAGTYSLPLSVTDAESRSGSGNATALIVGNLGTISAGANITQTVTLAAAEVKFFKFTLPDAISDPANWLDVWTLAGTLSNNDSEIAIYNASGNLEDADDDDGPGNYSALSYGLIAPTRPTDGGTASNGRDGTLAAGDYILAVGSFNTTFNATNFNATSTSTATGDVVLRVTREGPTAPAGTGLATPVAVLNDGSGSSLLTVTVAPGQFPVSTGLAVSADLSAAGGSASQAFVDDGTGGDVTAGDNIFSYTLSVANGATVGNFALPFTITDAESRTGTGNITFRVLGQPTVNGDLCRIFSPEFAGTLLNDVALAAGEVKWYTFQIPADASAAGLTYVDFNTFGSALVANNDTEIAVYTSAGTLVATDDDDSDGLLSQLSFGDTATPRPIDGTGVAGAGQDGDLVAGTYYLAVAAFNSTFASPWDVASTSAFSGTFDVNVRTNIAGCVADVDDGSATGTPDNGVTIDDLLYYLSIFNGGNVCADVDDGSATGTRDGGVTIDDLLYYLSRFNGGC